MIYIHNPRCSKSRDGIKILENKKLKFEIREYLKTPLTEEEILDLIKKIQNPIFELIRVKEDEYKQSKLSNQSTPIEIARAIAQYPVLLERPILINGSKAIIGRPPENILKII